MSHVFTWIAPKRLEKIKQCIEAVKHLPGDLAELGVYQAGSAKVIAETCADKPLHLFDTFTGLPEPSEIDFHKKGEFACSLEQVKDNLKEFPNIVYHPGFFPRTAKKHLKFSLVHLDCDLYKSVKSALVYFLPRLTGYLIVDDIGWQNCKGVDAALFEVFTKEQVQMTEGEPQGVIKVGEW